MVIALTCTFLSNYFHLNLVTNQSGKPSYVPKCRDATSWCISRITCTPCCSKFLTMVFSFCKYSRSKYPSWGSIPDHIAPSLTTLRPQLARSWAYLSSSRAAWYQGGCLATKLTPWNILILPLKITEISDVFSRNEYLTAGRLVDGTLGWPIFCLWYLGEYSYLHKQPVKKQLAKK